MVSTLRTSPLTQCGLTPTDFRLLSTPPSGLKSVSTPAYTVLSSSMSRLTGLPDRPRSSLRKARSSQSILLSAPMNPDSSSYRAILIQGAAENDEIVSFLKVTSALAPLPLATRTTAQIRVPFPFVSDSSSSIRSLLKAPRTLQALINWLQSR